MIRGFCHLAIGQETVSVGLVHGINKNDKVPLGASIAFAQKYTKRRPVLLLYMVTALLTRIKFLKLSISSLGMSSRYRCGQDSEISLASLFAKMECWTLVLSTVLARKFRGCEVCKTFMASNVIFRSGNLLDLKQIDKDAIEEVTDNLLNTQLCRN
ncbi:hypothetical protein C8R41DRAFT_863217 [Lentinula lateritia]|uniref:Uncharacterized protein n=1 Tax=Lentinula lateritia TaxID=40482 RepID=A0ABQ8VW99_9AGAR|nr:hypothetical protein C8R41DRAFT_863217 [Lentinula lateritia]